MKQALLRVLACAALTPAVVAGVLVYPLPGPASTGAEVSGYNPNFYDVGDPRHVSVGGGVANAGALPEPFANVSGFSDPGAIQNANASVYWEITFTGYTRTSNSPSVPVIISGAAFSHTTGSGSAGAGVANGIVGFPQFDVTDLQCGTTFAVCGAYQITAHLALEFTDFILISAGGSAGAAGGTYMAMNDPTIRIDPAWAAQHPGIGLVESSNVGNSATAPEPGTVLLMAMGLLTLRAGLRQRT